MSVDPSAVDPAEFIRNVRETDDKGLGVLMASEYRPFVLQGIFERFAEHLQPDAARSLDAVIHFKVLDHPDGGYDHYELRIASGACEVVHPPRDTDPDTTLRLKPVDFLRLVTGDADGRMLFLRRRLRIEGDVMLAARLPALFRIPR
jgi:putative sterol carrier protein